MQLYPIVLIGILLFADGGLGLADDGLMGLGCWQATVLAWVPVLLVVGLTFGGVEYCRSRLEASRATTAVIAAERMTRWARCLLLVHFALLVLVFGWLDIVRGVVGDGVLYDELITMLPPLVGVVGTWWAYYPIERRIRDAMLVRRLDTGQAIFPTPGRVSYVLTQVRLHLLFLLIPILLIITAAELIDLASTQWGWPGWVGDGGTMLAALAVVVTAPLLTRLVLEVEPVPEGPLVDDLRRVCTMHNVRVRRLLLWNTHGTMINAAVMGLVGPLRYVLLTDALLESMSRRQLEAVMAHEIGHIRRHHMPWLLVTVLAVIVVVSVPMFQVQAALTARADLSAPWLDGLSAATVTAVALGVFGLFGWVSRRFERQADAFAARHLSTAWNPADALTGRITAEASATVSSALETIARLNAVTTRRRSWRHGSIAWRQAYLASIVGRPLNRIPIDRQIRRIKIAAVVAVVLGVAWGVRREADIVAVSCSGSPRCTAPATTSSAWTGSPSRPSDSAAISASWPGPCAIAAPGWAATA